MMTEADAKQRWCPFARSLRGANRDIEGGPDHACRCLASQCLAWRWYGDDLGYCGLAGPASD